MVSSFESEPKPPAWPIAFCSDGAWLSVAMWSAAACCTSADSASSSWHSRGTAAACRSLELRSRPRLDSTLIVHESIVGSSVAESSWTSRPSTAGSAIAPRAFALHATSSASSDTACFCAGAWPLSIAAHSCWTRGFIDLLMPRPRARGAARRGFNGKEDHGRGKIAQASAASARRAATDSREIVVAKNAADAGGALAPAPAASIRRGGS